MDDGEITNMKVCKCPRGQLFHLSKSHRLVRFIEEIQRTATSGVVPHDAIEHYYCSVFAPLQRVGQRSSIDPALRQRDFLCSDGRRRFRCLLCARSASAHWR